MNLPSDIPERPLGSNPSAVALPCAELADADLMRGVASGKLNCLATLVFRHQHRVRCVAYRFTNRWDLADDITQETFLRLHRSAPRYEPTARFSTWLYRIVVNLCLDVAKRPKLAGLSDVDSPSTAAADSDLQSRERQQAVARAVADLPERQRIAVLLHRFEGLSHAEVAHSTGWSESAVESLLSRAYATLRVSLQNWKGA